MRASSRIGYGERFVSAVEQIVRLDQREQASHITGGRLLVAGGQARGTY
ncbi:MAG TPA: hypothetical protein VGE94_12875 [Chloroflexota bacterium]|jgi:hypothetical protein